MTPRPLLWLAFCLACQNPVPETETSRGIAIDSLKNAGDIPVFDGRGRLNVLIEIPAGSNAKWELNKENKRLEWQQTNQRPRVVDYLGYPGNYGLVPKTLLAHSSGGDGDPIDVLVLGPSVARGKVLSTRLIGVLILRDQGENDDKLLAVAEKGPFSQVESLAELDSVYPGVSTIIQLWFVNYKRKRGIEALGFYGPDSALTILEAALKAYKP